MIDIVGYAAREIPVPQEIQCWVEERNPTYKKFVFKKI
jgi:hypothetical protein